MKICKHKNIEDEPPYCIKCKQYVCVVCRCFLKNPVGLCSVCLDVHNCFQCNCFHKESF